MRAVVAALLLSLPATAFAQADDGSNVAPITKLPKVKKFVEATYPPDALRDRIAGSVVLELDISAEGLIENVGVVGTTTAAEVLSATTAAALGVIRSSTIADYGFTASATTAAAQLEFEPAEAEGTPVPVRIQYTYNFSLPPPPVIEAPKPTDTSTVAPEPGPGIVNFEGVIRERGTRRALSGVVVTVFRGEGEEATGFESLTDEEGKFTFVDLTPGEWKILAEAPGYYPVRTAELVVVGQVTEVTYYIERGSYNPYEVVVEAKRVVKEVNRRTLTAAEILKVPGTLGDPVNVVTNLPGVARPPGGGGQLLVRGSGPQDTGVYIDGILVPLVYHFGGLKSVIPAEVIEQVDFYPGNFSVEYGRATGGILDVRAKKLTPDQVHGSLDVSLLDTSAFLEIPIGDNAAVAIAGRRSYVDFIIESVVPSDSGVNLISAPRYYDAQILANWRPSEEHDLRLFGNLSDDVFEVLFDTAEANTQLQSGNLTAGTSFQRLMVEHNYTPSDIAKNRVIASIGHDQINFSLGQQFRFLLDLITFQVREAFDYKLDKNVTLTAGIDYLGTLADVEVLAPRPPREGEPVGDNNLTDTLFTRVEGQFTNNIAPYVEARLQFGDLSLVPGVRLDYFEDIDTLSVDPRLVARYKIDDQWLVKAGAGLVHQPPQPADTDEIFGNPDLGVQRGAQYSVGAEWRPLDFVSVDGTLFYKDLRALAVRVDAPLNVDNVGTGEVFGFELMVKHDFKNNLRGWMSYTLSRALRQNGPDVPNRLFDFDQTHILNLVMSYIFPENWEVGVRWRFISGSPFTPFINAIYVADIDEYVPVAGEVNSDRFPIFHQLDIRIDKTWVWDAWRLSAYLSLLNTYNQANTEGWNYNYNFSERSKIQSLPILPILGLKGEF